MAARVLTAFAHGTFFGVGSVVATTLVAPNKKASAIAVMFTGLTVANILGVPFGTWLGQGYGWRSTFWAVTLIGLVAFAIIAVFVPKDKAAPEVSNLRDDLAVLARPQVLMGLLTTVLSWVGVFAVFTYIAPILIRISGFSEAAVSPILLVFGGGLVAGNLLGGRLADRRLIPALFGSLLTLAAVLLLMTFAAHHQIDGSCVRGPARRGRVRNRAAVADVGAGKGRRRRAEPRFQLQHRRVQSRQRDRRMARRFRDRPWAGSRCGALGRGAGAACRCRGRCSRDS